MPQNNLSSTGLLNIPCLYLGEVCNWSAVSGRQQSFSLGVWLISRISSVDLSLLDLRFHPFIWVIFFLSFFCHPFLSRHISSRGVSVKGQAVNLNVHYESYKSAKEAGYWRYFKEISEHLSNITITETKAGENNFLYYPIKFKLKAGLYTFGLDPFHYLDTLKSLCSTGFENWTVLSHFIGSKDKKVNDPIGLWFFSMFLSSLFSSAFINGSRQSCDSFT